MTITAANRYAKDWNGYSEHWDRSYGETYEHLGDEWNDDGTGQRTRDENYFLMYASRFLRPDMTVLEVGPGGGKWTVRIAPLVKKVIVLDVAESMLARTRARCESLGITNVEYVLAGGRDFRPVASASVDFFFSYDVFVHIALEDTFPYAGEIARVLKPGGVSACHYAIGSTPGGMARIEQTSWWYRGGERTLGQYYYYSPDALRRMYEHCGLYVAETHEEWCYCVVIARRMGESLVANLEGALRKAVGSDAGTAARSEALADLRGLPAQLQAYLDQMLPKLEAAATPQDAIAAAQDVRRLWRGL
ncbi:MAG: class I SAM-dependent methyltransferase [Acidobacteria bacterium]|nr:class I SAM-dependent methyltransferase [Acidobacteriota bacterium]